MYTSGGYVDYNNFPVGLTIEHGILVNKNLERFNGLVGKTINNFVHIYDLSEKFIDIMFYSYKNKCDLKNVADFKEFIGGMSDCESSIFQTHLLYYKDVNFVDSIGANKSRRNRLFLAKVKSTTTNLEQLVVIDLKDTYGTLKECVTFTLNVLQDERRNKIEWIINLDGGYDYCLNVFNLESQQSIIQKRSKKELCEQGQLLVYFYE